MFTDPIVEEVRNARQRHAKRFDYDLKKIVEDLKEREKRADRRIVSFPPKPAKDLPAIS